MLSLALIGSLLALDPPPESGQVGQPIGPEPAAEAIVVPPPAEGPASLPPAEEAVAVPPGSTEAVNQERLVIVDRRTIPSAPRPAAPVQMVPRPPWSGSGRLVGGSVMLVAGVGLLTAATFEFSDGRDTTKPIISQVPAGVAMLVAGGVMIGTGHRDRMRLNEWEAATKIDAPPSGNGLIVGGVTASSLGILAAITTSIAVDLDLDAPYSIPAGWATAGVAMGTGVALTIAGIVRRSRYGKWRDGVVATPMVAPTRAGASLGLVGNF